MSHQIEKRLRVGLLVDSLSGSDENIELARWLAENPLFEPSIIVLEQAAHTDPLTTTFGSPFTIRIRSVWKRYFDSLALSLAVSINERLYQWKNRKIVDSSLRYGLKASSGESLRDILPTWHRFTPNISPSGFVHRLSGADLKDLLTSNYDVMVRLGSGILRGGILSASKYGILSLHHGDNRVIRGGPWGFWEVFEKSVSTGFTLQRLTDDLDGGEILYRGNYSTQKTVIRNRHNLVQRSYPILRGVLQELARTGMLHSVEAPFPYLGKIYRTPSVWQSLRFATPNLLKMLRSYLHRLSSRSHHGWSVGITKGDWINASFRNHHLVPTVDGNWVADPFIVSWNGQYGVFLEEYICNEGKGRISFCALDQTGRPSAPTPVLSESFHLSFPWTFEFEGKLYMTPETYEKREIRLYRCLQFPYSWEFVGLLMESVAAVDPMVFQRGEDWYLFVNIDPLDAGDPNSELHVFTSKNPILGDWNPVFGSPSVVDPRQARNGGLLQNGNRLFRVGQRQEFGIYGMSSGIYEVLELGPEGYSEQISFDLKARWNDDLRGPHHVSSSLGFTAFDFQQSVRSGTRDGR